MYPLNCDLCDLSSTVSILCYAIGDVHIFHYWDLKDFNNSLYRILEEDDVNYTMMVGKLSACKRPLSFLINIGDAIYFYFYFFTCRLLYLYLPNDTTTIYKKNVDPKYEYTTTTTTYLYKNTVFYFYFSVLISYLSISFIFLYCIIYI